MATEHHPDWEAIGAAEVPGRTGPHTLAPFVCKCGYRSGGRYVMDGAQPSASFWKSAFRHVQRIVNGDSE